MKLIGLTGVQQGREFPVPPAGLTIGRGADNDVVLESDRQASRYHARIESAGGAWVVRDRESVNGVFVNGQHIQGTAPLAEGDEILIGQRGFRVVMAGGAAPAPAAAKPAAPEAAPVVVFKTGAPPEAEPTPVTFTPMQGTETPPPLGQPPAAAAEAEAKRRRIMRLAILGGGLFLLIILLGLLLAGPGAKKPAAPAPGAGTAAALAPDAAADLKNLRVNYESLKAAPGVLFRYELRIRGGNVSILVDDPLNNRCVEDGRTVEPERLKPLTDLLLSDKVLALASPARENAVGESMRTRLTVLCGSRGNEILVENTRPPAGFREAEQAVQDFAQDIFGFGAEPMPYEEAMRLAEEDYLNARRLYDEQNVDPANLNAAVKAYALVLTRLKNYDRKPAWHAECQMQSDAAQKELDAKVTKLRRDAQALKSAGHLAEARQTFRQLLDLFANNWEGNRDAAWAHQEIVTIDNMLARQKDRKR